MEESLEGGSINDMVRSLVETGYDEDNLQHELDCLGFEKAASIRNKKYKIHEIRKYNVDDAFPKITEESFKNNKLPDSIIQIEYKINLDGLKYEQVQ